MNGYEAYLDNVQRVSDLKANWPWGYAVFMNLNASYVVKPLEMVMNELVANVWTVGCEIDEPLFLCYVSGTTKGDMYYMTPLQNEFEYFNPLELAMFRRSCFANMFEFKIGVEHFRKVGSWLVFDMLITQLE